MTLITRNFEINNGKYTLINNPARMEQFEKEYHAAGSKIRKPRFPRTNRSAITKDQAVAFIKDSIECKEYDSALSAADLAGVVLIFIPSDVACGFTILVDPQPFDMDNCPIDLAAGEAHLESRWVWEVAAVKYGRVLAHSMPRESKLDFMHRAKQLPYTVQQWQNAVANMDAEHIPQEDMRKEFEAVAYAGWV